MKEIVNMEKKFKHRTRSYKDVVKKLDLDHIKAGDYISPIKSYQLFKENELHKVFSDKVNALYILDDSERKHYLYSMNLYLWGKHDNLSDLKLGDIITPVVDMIDFTEGLEYEVKNSDMNPDILFIVSNSNKVISVSLLAPKLWSKVEDSIDSVEEDLDEEIMERVGIPDSEKFCKDKGIEVNFAENPYIMKRSDSPNVVELGKEETSGGFVNYYQIDINNPIREGVAPYTVEFEDIALALGLTPMEYNIMKDLWRNASARTNGIGKAGNTQLRTYQKAAHYSNILLSLEERKQNER